MTISACKPAAADRKPASASGLRMTSPSSANISHGPRARDAARLRALRHVGAGLDDADAGARPSTAAPQASAETTMISANSCARNAAQASDVRFRRAERQAERHIPLCRRRRRRGRRCLLDEIEPKPAAIPLGDTASCAVGAPVSRRGGDRRDQRLRRGGAKTARAVGLRDQLGRAAAVGGDERHAAERCIRPPRRANSPRATA